MKNLALVLLFLISAILLVAFVFSMYYFYTNEKINGSELIAFLLTASVAFLSHGWNIYSHYEMKQNEKLSTEKNRIEKNYDEVIQRTVLKSMDVLDDIMEIFGQGIYVESPAEYIIKKLDSTVFNKRFTGYGLCEEADSYMEKRKLESKFSFKFDYVAKERRIDDLFLALQNEAKDNTRSNEEIRKALFESIKILTNTKVELQKEIDKGYQAIINSLG